MSRRQVAPGIWETEPPATPHRFSRAYSSVPAVTISEMRPVIHAQYRTRSKPPNPLSIHPENRIVVCGAAMRYDETCGRKSGHRDSHRSRSVMDTDAKSRRGAAQYIR